MTSGRSCKSPSITTAASPVTWSRAAVNAACCCRLARKVSRQLISSDSLPSIVSKVKFHYRPLSGLVRIQVIGLLEVVGAAWTPHPCSNSPEIPEILVSEPALQSSGLVSVRIDEHSFGWLNDSLYNHLNRRRIDSGYVECLRKLSILVLHVEKQSSGDAIGRHGYEALFVREELPQIHRNLMKSGTVLLAFLEFMPLPGSNPLNSCNTQHCGDYDRERQNAPGKLRVGKTQDPQ